MMPDHQHEKQQRLENERHYRQLEQMYYAAPINDFYAPEINIGEGDCEIVIDVKPQFFHAARAVHGSVYFKMLDDAAFFAANSVEYKVFVLTTSFTTYLTRPITDGKITAVGKLVNKNSSQFVAESVAYNAEGKEIARGSGLFVRSKIPLETAMGYTSNHSDAGL